MSKRQKTCEDDQINDHDGEGAEEGSSSSSTAIRQDAVESHISPLRRYGEWLTREFVFGTIFGYLNMWDRMRLQHLCREWNAQSRRHRSWPQISLRRVPSLHSTMPAASVFHHWLALLSPRCDVAKIRDLETGECMPRTVSGMCRYAPMQQLTSLTVRICNHSDVEPLDFQTMLRDIWQNLRLRADLHYRVPRNPQFFMLGMPLLQRLELFIANRVSEFPFRLELGGSDVHEIAKAFPALECLTLKSHDGHAVEILKDQAETLAALNMIGSTFGPYYHYHRRAIPLQ